MNRLRRFSPQIRLLLAVVLALCLGVRMLAPAGFMPSFATGSLAIIPCPDAEGAPTILAMSHMAPMAKSHMAMSQTATSEPVHDHGQNGFHHQSCPYASANSLAGLEFAVAIAAVIALLAILRPLARALPLLRRRATRDRPPAQGPPLPA